MSTPFDSFGLIQDIDIRLTVELGRKQMRLRDLLALREGSVIELDRLTDEPLDILANGRPIARGEVIAKDNRFAIRVLELIGPGATNGAAAMARSEDASQIAERRAPPPIVENL